VSGGWFRTREKSKWKKISLTSSRLCFRYHLPASRGCCSSISLSHLRDGVARDQDLRHHLKISVNAIRNILEPLCSRGLCRSNLLFWNKQLTLWHPGKEEAIIYPLSASTSILWSYRLIRAEYRCLRSPSLSLRSCRALLFGSHLSKLKYNLCLNFWSFELSRTVCVDNILTVYLIINFVIKTVHVNFYFFGLY